MSPIKQSTYKARWHRRLSILSAVFLIGTCGQAIGEQGSAWPTGGQDLGNTRNNEAVALTREDILNTQEAWSAKLDGDPWTQPTVAWGKVFMGDNLGRIYCFDAATGASCWKKELRSYWDNPGPNNPTDDSNDPNDPNNFFSNPQPNIAATRSALAAHDSPVHGPVLIFGDQAGNPTLPQLDGNGDPIPMTVGVPLNGANIYMVDADDGELILMTKVAQDHPFQKNDDGKFPAQVGADYTVLTGAMAVYGDTIVTGVAGLAEANPSCAPGSAGGCTLRGRVMAFDADTLKLKWQTYTTPTKKGYAGASVWQSTPAIDPERNRVYVGTGDNYNTPHDACYIAIDKMGKTRDQIEAEFMATCIGKKHKQEWARNYVDSILALDLRTGHIKWAHRTLMYDTWNLACLAGGNWLNECGPDMDFSHHPMLCDSTDYGPKGVLVVGQKTGIMRGLDPDTGAVLWETGRNNQDLPASAFHEGLVGGFQWGAACTAAGTVIGLAANSYAQAHTTEGGDSTKGGSIVGFDVNTGAVNFETLPDTTDEVHPGLQSDAAVVRGLDAIAAGGPPATIGAASCAGGVCGWGTSGVFGSLLLTDVTTGETLWKRETANGSVLWGGAFADLPQAGKMWFVGSGYESFNTGVKSDGTNPNFWAYRFVTNDDD